MCSNKEGFDQNSLNKSKKVTLQTIYECFNRISIEYEYNLSECDIKSIIFNTYTLIFDTESNQPLEISSLM